MGHQPILLSRKEIDARLWDGLVASSVQQNLYAYSWYLDVVCPDWCAFVLSGELAYSAALPVPLGRRWFWRVVEQPLFCQFLGFVSRQTLSAIQAEEMLRLLVRHFPYISSYAFHPGDFKLIECIRSHFNDVCFATHHTLWLGLWRHYSDIYKQFSPDRRRNIRVGYAAGWRLVNSQDVRPLLDLFMTNHAAKMADGVDGRLSKVLVALSEALQQKGVLDLWYAVRDGRTEAGCLFLKLTGTTVYLFNAASEKGRRGNARSVLIDGLIKAQSESDTIFDFESPEVESIAGFYESFGAHRIPYITIRRNPLPQVLQILQRQRGALLRVWRSVRTRPVLF